VFIGYYSIVYAHRGIRASGLLVDGPAYTCLSADSVPGPSFGSEHRHRPFELGWRALGLCSPCLVVGAAVCRWGLCPCCPGVRRCLSGSRGYTYPRHQNLVHIGGRVGYQRGFVFVRGVGGQSSLAQWDTGESSGYRYRG